MMYAVELLCRSDQCCCFGIYQVSLPTDKRQRQDEVVYNRADGVRIIGTISFSNSIASGCINKLMGLSQNYSLVYALDLLYRFT